MLAFLGSAVAVVLGGCLGGDGGEEGLTWAKSYGTEDGEEIAYAIDQTDDDGDGEKDDGFIVAGSMETGSTDVWLVKLDGFGNVKWSKTYGEQSNEVAYAVRQTPDGGFVAAGFTDSFGEGGKDAWVIRVDAEGEFCAVGCWQRTFSTAGDDVARSVETTADGGSVLAGSTARDGAVDDGWVLKLSAAGVTQVFRVFPGRPASSAYEAPDGGLIVAGAADGLGSWVYRLDSQGNVCAAGCWQQEIALSVGSDQEQVLYESRGIESIAPSPDGGWVVAGMGVRFLDAIWVLKLAEDGSTEWSNTFSGRGGDSLGFSVSPAIDGGYGVAGMTRAFGGGGQCEAEPCANVWMLKLDDGGDVEWERTYGGALEDVGHALRATSDGGFVVAGVTDSISGSPDFWVLKTDDEGEIAATCPAGIGAESQADVDTPLDVLRQGGIAGSLTLVLADTTSIQPVSSNDFVVTRQCAGTVEHELTVTVSGEGTVSSSPLGLACGPNATCVVPVAGGTDVTLGALPALGWQLVGFGGECGPDGAVTVDTDRSCTVDFERKPGIWVLSVDVEGEGTVTSDPLGIDCGDTCAAEVAAGQVQLTAAVPRFWRFVAWGGDCAGTAPTTSVVMTSDRSCSATLELNASTVTIVNETPEGGRLISGIGHNCGTRLDDILSREASANDCTQLSDRPAVTFLAQPLDRRSYDLLRWGGDCAGSDLQARVELTNADGSFRDANCTARFFRHALTLANITITPEDPLTHEVIRFDASESAVVYRDPNDRTVEADIVFFGWDLDGDGVFDVTGDRDTARIVEHAYPAPERPFGATGTPPSLHSYDVTLRVTRVAQRLPREQLTQERTLTVTVGEFLELSVFKAGGGSGTVRSRDGLQGIDCGTACLRQYPMAGLPAANRTITIILDPTPDADSAFAGWGGWGRNDPCPSGRGVTLNPTDGVRKSCTALFRPSGGGGGGILTVFIAGDGGGQVLPPRPLGIWCGNTAFCASYPQRTTVSLTAQADPGSEFARWSGDCAGRDPSITFNVAQGLLTCTATFNEIRSQETLTIVKAGTGDGTVTAALGIDCGLDCQEDYVRGLGVTFTAAPDSGSGFVGWGNDCTAGGFNLVEDARAITTRIFVARTTTCTATFTSLSPQTPAPNVLEVFRVGIVFGNVTSLDPAHGIDCGTDCREEFDPTQPVTVTLVAHDDPATGARFLTWIACDQEVGNQCTITVDRTRNATAFYAPTPAPPPQIVQTFELTISKTGSGSGTVTSSPPGIDCGTACSAPFEEDTAVALLAAPDAGSTFDGLSGDAGCASGSVTIDAAHSCVATFTELPAVSTLTVEKDGAGTGTVTSFPAGIDCGTDCSESYVAGQTIELTATPDPDSLFVEWNGSLADLAITGMTVSPARADVGEEVTWTIEVTNYGPHRAGSVAVHTLASAFSSLTSLPSGLPPEVSFVSASASQGSCTPPFGSITVLVCSIGGVDVGATASLTVVVTVDRPSMPVVQGLQMVSNGALILSEDPAAVDPDRSNDVASADLLLFPATGYDLAITSFEATPDQPALGGDITYTITATNFGPQAAPNVIISTLRNDTRVPGYPGGSAP